MKKKRKPPDGVDVGRRCQITVSYSAVSVHCTHKRSSAERWADSAVLIPHRPSPLTSYPDNATIHKRRRTQDLELRCSSSCPSCSSPQQRCCPNHSGWSKDKKKKNTTRNRVTTYANDLTANQMTSLWNGRSVNHHLVVKRTSAEAPRRYNVTFRFYSTQM